MSKLLIPGIAATVVAIYFFKRKRKEHDFEVNDANSVMDTELLVEQRFGPT
jgi:hypothetical protein